MDDGPSLDDVIDPSVANTGGNRREVPGAGGLEALALDKPKPLGAPRNNLDDRTWMSLADRLDSEMFELARKYSGPRKASPELLAFIDTLNQIFSDLPRNTPVSLRNRLEETYKEVFWLVSGRRVNFNPSTGGGRNPQRKLPGT